MSDSTAYIDIRPGQFPGQTQVPHRQQAATGPVSPESWPTSLASIGHCGGVQHRETKSAPETRCGACGGTLTGNHRCARCGSHRARGRAASERSEIVSLALTYPGPDRNLQLTVVIWSNRDACMVDKHPSLVPMSLLRSCPRLLVYSSMRAPVSLVSHRSTRACSTAARCSRCWRTSRVRSGTAP